MNTIILSVEHLTKRFASFTAVNDISFSVKEGEIVGLLGPNGAGKTTTIMMILGITTLTVGTITVFGKDFTTNRESILQDMNYSSAYTRVPWQLTPKEHLSVFAHLYNVSDIKNRVSELMRAFGLEDVQNMQAGELSAGNIARVNLAKAFINRPKLVLLDEPTSSLDPDIADRVRAYITEAKERFATTVLITSHNMAEIEELCDRVIFINHGKIVDEDTPENLAKKIKKTKIRLMMKDGQKRTVSYCRQKKLSYHVSDRFITVAVKEEMIAQFLNDLAQLGVEYSEIRIDTPTLEDYFIGEVRHER